MEKQPNLQDSQVLHYAAISAKLLTETNPEAVEGIKQEQAEIESSLGMSKEDIILEAKRLTVG